MTEKLSAHFNTFKSNYEKLAGRVYTAFDPEEAVRHIDQIITESKGTKVVLGPLLSDLDASLRKHLKARDVATVELDFETADMAHLVNEADVGISMAEFAIAFTGTIVEVTTEDTYRLISSLPRVHIALLPGSQIVSSLEEAAPKLREIHEAHPNHCNMTFISGPSRTADIEMKLFLGVHGPQESHVVVCNWQDEMPLWRKMISKLRH